jgi:hypothetical protein
MTYLKTFQRKKRVNVICRVGSLIFACTLPNSQVVISEILFNPLCEGSNQEFVEIVNIGENPIDISGWVLSDNHSVDELLPENPILFPNEYAVILEQDYEFCFDSVFPDEVSIIYVDDNSIGNGLGNSADQILISNATGDTIAFTQWQTGIEQGHSLEKIVLSFEDVSANWRQSVDIYGSPGGENSVSSFIYDAGLDSVWVLPEYPMKNEIFNLFVIVGNYGLLNVNLDMYINGTNLISFELNSAQKDTIMITEDFMDYSGRFPFLINLVTPGDFEPSNDSLVYFVNVPFDFNDVVINEIMYDPLSGSPEWIEIENRLNYDIDLLNWYIDDADFYSPNQIVESSTLESSGYAVITGMVDYENMIMQSGFPGLNNNSDNIYLFDHTGKMIDHVGYQSSWGGGDGFSLERITRFLDSNNQRNWGICVADSGNTAGEENSIFVIAIEAEGALLSAPNPFSPNNDGLDDELIISYNMPFSQVYLKAIIYDVRGRRQKVINDGVSASAGIIRWDGKRSDGKTCVTGQYILVIEAKDRWSKQVWKGTDRIIIANNMN